MPILYAELQVAGLRVPCARASYSFTQVTDYAGRPSSTVRVGLVKVLLTGEVAVWPVWKTLMQNAFRRESGHLLFFEAEGQTFSQVTFYDAACVHYESRLDAHGQGRTASLETEFHFSAAALAVDGTFVQAHSRIRWLTDRATSFRALTKPAEPLPSLSLAALVSTGVLRAEQLATGLLQRVITPAGAVATEFLGVGVAAIGRAASLTAGLVLTPANDPNAPGYDAEKNLTRDHPVLPPDPDAFRLAELEAKREQGTLSAAEQAELIALLAKVRGIRVGNIPSKLTLRSLNNETPEVREATDEEAAEIAAIGEKHAISRKKNVAYAEGELAGKPYRNEAHRGTNSKPSTAKAKPFEIQRIKTQPTSADIGRGVSDSDVRAYDSEVKILEELLDQTVDKLNISGKIKIVSERPICDSCWDGISQVEQARPNIIIDRV